MLPDLTSAEKQALEATKLESFPVNLQEIRRTVAQLLSEFGRYDFFNEYTIHSFEHVYEMLKRNVPVAVEIGRQASIASGH